MHAPFLGKLTERVVIESYEQEANCLPFYSFPSTLGVCAEQDQPCFTVLAVAPHSPPLCPATPSPTTTNG